MFSPSFRQHNGGARGRNRAARLGTAFAAALIAAGPAAAATDCTAFLTGIWMGEHNEPGILSIQATMNFGADGNFYGEIARMDGTTSASSDMPAGTWTAAAGKDEKWCEITFTNGRSGEVTKEQAEILGPDSYGTGKDATPLVMMRQHP